MPQPGRRSAEEAAAGPSASPLSPTGKGGFPLVGTSELPDPATHAYRKDLADVALAGRVVASHYAEPLARKIVAVAAFLSLPDPAADPVGSLAVGDEVRILDNSRGWAWGYGPDGRVGYVSAEALLP